MAERITVQQLVQEWIHIIPSQPVRMAALVESKIAATNKGIFLGQDTSDPNADGADIYTNSANLPTAIASILNHVQNRANFHPLSSSPEVLAQAFDRYVNELDAVPFFSLHSSVNTKHSFYSSDYNILIDQLVDLYRGATEKDLVAIKDATVSMGKSVFGQKEAEDWKNLFSQSVINYSVSSAATVLVYYTSLHMFHGTDGKSEISRQDYEVRQAEYVVLPDMIKTYAKKLAALDKRKVDDWVKSESSPERENAVQPCFDK